MNSYFQIRVPNWLGKFINVETSEGGHQVEPSDAKRAVKIVEDAVKKTKVSAPGKRSSVPDLGPVNALQLIEKQKFIDPGFTLEAIPTIRNLTKTNPDIGQVLYDLVQLTNTGHELIFRDNVPPEKQLEMIIHLNEASKTWGQGVAGLHGLINKHFSQLLVSGAIANEWVPDIRKTRIENNILVNPETIRISYSSRKRAYQYFQQPKHIFDFQNIHNLRRLNENTFRYFALNGDLDIPYGIPPFLNALDAIATQQVMLGNIQHISKLMGILGFLEALVEKPDMEEDENPADYDARLDKLLKDTQDNVKGGMSEGIVTGFKNDHEFQFMGTTKAITGLDDVFKQNEQQIASGVKVDSAFLGRSYGTSETQITVIFTKMISQLRNLQKIEGENLLFGFRMELSFNGFLASDLKEVRFKRSTLTDDLKFQQSREILIRNLNALRNDGIISQEQYAIEAEYDKPHKDQAMIEKELAEEREREVNREKGKDASDKKVRDKNRPQDKTIKNNTNGIKTT